VEASRKHGPFDPRWSCIRKDNSGALSTAPLLSAAEVAEALDWQAFSARSFPERRRHDSEPRSAYAAYRLGREWRQRPTGLRLVSTEPASAPVELGPGDAGAARLLAAVAAMPPTRSARRLRADQR
jgi:hypothetical protein